MIAATITSKPKASEYFKGSIVSYATSIKNEKLGVPLSVITKETVNSPEVASLMAEGLHNSFGTDYEIAVTGLAGPGDPTVEDVGRIFICVRGLFTKTVKNLNTKINNRHFNRKWATLVALNMLANLILDELRLKQCQ